jgi:hypothetical protein
MTADSADDPVVPGQDGIPKDGPSPSPRWGRFFSKSDSNSGAISLSKPRVGFSFTLDRQLALRLPAYIGVTKL